MKKVLTIIIALCCVVQFACKKRSGPANGNSVQPDNGLDSLVSMSASISGRSFSTDSVYGYLVKHIGDTARINLLITGSQHRNDTASTISFTITDYAGIGTYPINPPYISATYYVGNIRHYATSGQIVVTSDTQYGVIGTFSFVADSTNVTDGKFNAAKP